MEIKKLANVLLLLLLANCSSTVDSISTPPHDAAPTTYRLTVRFTSPLDEIVSNTRLVWIHPSGLVTEQELVSTEDGSYDFRPVEISLDASTPEFRLNVGWDWYYSEMNPEYTAFLTLFYSPPDGGAYQFHGQVRITDQIGRSWLGYPIVDTRGIFGGHLRFVPEENCRPGYLRRRDNICLR